MKSVLRIAFVLAWSVFLAAPGARAGDDVGRAPPPRWVAEPPVPEVRASRLRQVEDGIYYLLLDSQVKPEGANETFYTRNAYKVTERSGLEEAARFEIDYDPGRERVVLHHIRIIRNGVSSDRMNGAVVQVLRREQGLDKGVFDGRKTIHVEIKDVEVGDIVDYSYSWESNDSFWPGHFFGHVTTNWAVPLEVMRYRLIWPSDRPLSIRNRNTDLKPTRTPSGRDTIYEWRMVDAEPVHSEDGTPQWYPTWGTVTLSSMTSWSQVVNWALPLYAGKDVLPPALAARVQSIMQKYPRAEDRITQAMRLVEDDLRYVSLSIGAGSYTPRSPAEVFRSGFGDCKDKSQLLVALLRAMGIEAYVALTDMDEGPSLAEVAPAASVFDHAIVQVRFRGRSYWLDPTGANEGGRFPHLAALNYGYALPVAPGQKSLERIVRPEAAQPTYRTVERYELGSGEHPGMTLNVETIYLDAEADAMRSDVASKSTAQIESDYLKFYTGMYPGLTRERPLRIADDRDRNRIVVSESYRLSSGNLRRNKLIERFQIKASSLDTYDKVPSGHRLTPYTLSYPVNREHTIVVVTPGRRPPAPRAVSLDGVGFRYTLGVTRAGDTLILDYRLTGHEDVLTPKDTAAVAGDADTVTDDNYWYLDLTSTLGGVIGGKPAQSWQDLVVGMLAMIGLITVLVGLGFALDRGLHADDAYAANGVFYPVGAGKFVLMCAATFGLYAFFWMWKCWRWYAAHNSRPISPFGRAAFGMYWLYPLFAAVARRGTPPAWLRAAGAVTAGLFVVWVTACAVLLALGLYPLPALLAGTASSLCVLPAVMAVNRLNAAPADVRNSNTQLTQHSAIAVMAGLFCWLVVFTALTSGLTAIGAS